MNPDIAPIEVRFEVDTSGLKAAADAADRLGDEVGRSLEKAGTDGADKLGEGLDGKKLGVLGVAAGTAIGNGISRAAGAALSGIQNLVAGAFAEANELNKLTAASDAVIKSTGAVAGVTAEEMKNLAGEIETASGAMLDELDVINGQNVLATFTNIRDVAGEGNDIFTQATKAASNLSIALGQDMQSSVTQIGKALNDPIAGLGSLSRAGVQFTDAQKEQIEALVAAGDTMGAQKIILAELEVQFGGAYAAMADTPEGKIGTAMDSIKDTMRDAAAEALPKIADLAKSFSEKVTPALQAILPIVVSVFGFIADNIGPITVLVGVLGTLAAIVKVATVVQAAYNLVLIANPIGLVVAAVVALIAAIVWVATETTFFQDTWENLSKAFGDFFTGIGEWAGEAWTAITDWFAGVGEWLGNLGGQLYTAAQHIWSQFVNGALDVLFTLPNAVADIMAGIPFLSDFAGDIKVGLSAMQNRASSALGGGGAATVVNNYNVSAQGLTVAQVQQDASRRARLNAPVGGYA